MRISAPLRPGIPNGLAPGPLKNDTMPSLTGAGACWADAMATDVSKAAKLKPKRRQVKPAEPWFVAFFLPTVPRAAVAATVA